MIAGSGIPETDRRDDDRVDFFSDVTVMAVTELMEGAGADVSRNGIYVVTPHDLPDGSLVDVTFPLGGDDRFRGVGEIQWRQRQPVGEELRWGLGIEFAYATPEDRASLRAFVQRRAHRHPTDPPDGLSLPDDLARRAPGADPERRGGRRYPVSSEVRLKTVAHLTRASAADLSPGGIRFVANREFDVGGLVDLEFESETRDRDFELLGQVKWREPQPFGDNDEFAHGVEFVDPRPSDQSALEELVGHRRGSGRVANHSPSAPVC